MRSEPGDTIPGLRKKFFVFLGLAVLMQQLMHFYSDGLSSRTIIDFELAKSVAQVQDFFSLWGTKGILQMQKSIYADFLFLACYSIALFWGTRFLGQLSGHFIFRKAGNFFSILALAAGLCDTIENISMLQTLQGNLSASLIHLTHDIALIKFSLIMIVLLFMFSSFLYWVIDRMTERKWSKY